MEKTRQKACIACAESKRRCDKQLPECQRCLDRDVDCHYPRPKGRRRRPQGSLGPHASLPQDGSLQLDFPWQSSQIDPDMDGLDLVNWAAVGDTLDMSLIPDVTIPRDIFQDDTMSKISSAPDPPAYGALTRNDKAGDSSVTGPWFLRDEVWARDYRGRQGPHRSADFDLESFIEGVRGMLRSWTRDGHNDFIHQRLHERGMPSCVGDAFTTLSTYMNCTPAVKGAVLQITEHRMSSLVSHSVPDTDALGQALSEEDAVRVSLAHVHALFVYLYILLFDGSVPARIAGERQIPTLRLWLSRLWGVTEQFRSKQRKYRAGDCPILRSKITEGAFDSRYYDAATELWRLWVLTESVRRSHLIAETVVNIYECMAKGWAECTGTARFTANRGLWAAGSAVAWFELSCANPPLLASSVQPERYISEHNAGEFDDFAKVIWCCLVGTDKMQCWIDGNNKEKYTVS